MADLAAVRRRLTFADSALGFVPPWAEAASGGGRPAVIALLAAAPAAARAPAPLPAPAPAALDAFAARLALDFGAGAGADLTEVSVPAPSVAAPSVAAPSVPAPSVAAPSVAAQSVAAPSVPAPSVAAPSVAAPSVAAPSVAAPARLLEYVGGVDISFVPDTDRAVATLVVLAFPALAVVYETSARVTLTAPYRAGFLAEREAPPLLALLARVRAEAPAFVPQVVFVDGNGLLHPRACGLACSLGVAAGLPSIGVAKKLLAVGVDPAAIRAQARASLGARGDLLVIKMRGAESAAGAKSAAGALAAVLRMAPAAADAAAPVYVSVGDKMSLEAAVALTLLCSVHRVPEPVRQADLRSREEVRRWLAE